jgi:hypothetical protein
MAIYAPRTAPIVAGIPSQTGFKVVNIFCLVKLLTDEKVWKKILIRLVPFAIFAGKPSRIRRERLITDPPPDNVLMNPTKIPETMRTIILITDISKFKIY